MKTNKFRVWDKQQKEFHTNRDWGLSLDGTHIIGFSSHDSWNDDRGYKIKITKNLVVQQCTGLKDKNDVEIYEGDIIQIDDKDETRIYKIVFEDGYFGLYRGDKTKHALLHPYKNACTIIGNIFENSELLK